LGHNVDQTLLVIVHDNTVFRIDNFSISVHYAFITL